MAATRGWIAVNTSDVTKSILHSSEIQAYRLGNGADTTVVPWTFGEQLGDVLARAEALKGSGGEVPVSPAAGADLPAGSSTQSRKPIRTSSTGDES